MRYEIQRQSERRFVVFDTQTQSLARGRFHTRAAAEEWVLAKTAERALAAVHGAPSGIPGRARAYLITNPDFYGTNEQNCFAVTANLIKRLVAG